VIPGSTKALIEVDLKGTPIEVNLSVTLIEMDLKETPIEMDPTEAANVTHTTIHSSKELQLLTMTMTTP
jgi:hypothetical protein